MHQKPIKLYKIKLTEIFNFSFLKFMSELEKKNSPKD